MNKILLTILNCLLLNVSLNAGQLSGQSDELRPEILTPNELKTLVYENIRNKISPLVRIVQSDSQKEAVLDLIALEHNINISSIHPRNIEDLPVEFHDMRRRVIDHVYSENENSRLAFVWHPENNTLQPIKMANLDKKGISNLVDQYLYERLAKTPGVLPSLNPVEKLELQQKIKAAEEEKIKVVEEAKKKLSPIRHSQDTESSLSVSPTEKRGISSRIKKALFS